MEEQEDDFSACLVPTISDVRWHIVAIAGVPLSIVSLFCNLFIAVVLLRSRHSHFWFLAVLAISDSFLSFMYPPVVAMDLIKDRLQYLWLNQAYWVYLPSMLSLCTTCMTFSTFLIALATIERFLITEKHPFLGFFRSHRGFLVAVVAIASLILKGTLYFEIEMVRNDNCTGLTEYKVNLTPLAENWFYNNIFRFYVRNITTVLIPFFLLAFLNVRIVRTLQKQQRAAQMFRFATSRHKLKVRSATRLTVLIVCSYLIANVLNVVVTIWEYVNFDSTQGDLYIYYELMTDVVSVMYIAMCAMRLAVYFFCNQEIRNEVISLMTSVCSPTERKKVRSQSTSNGKGAAGELDSIALAIARRLIMSDSSVADHSEEHAPLDGSPIHAIVIANGYARCPTGADEV